MLRSLVGTKDESGNGYTIQRNLPNENLEKALMDGTAIMWIDINDPVEDDLPWLESTLDLHPAVVQDLNREDRRPSMLVYTQYVFLSLFQPVMRLKQVNAREIHCLIGDNYFITVRRNETKTVDDAYERATKDITSWEHGAAYFLYLTAQFVVDAYYPLLDKLTVTLNDLENAALSGNSISQPEVYHIKHQLMRIRQTLSPQREVLSNVVGQERLVRNPENRDLFRHLYERLLRVYDVLDSQGDFTNNVLDLIRNREASRLTNAVNRLTILSMIFLPLTFLIGLFGLNFVTTDPGFVIPMSGSLFFGLILVLMLLSAGFMTWFFKYRGWL